MAVHEKEEGATIPCLIESTLDFPGKGVRRESKDNGTTSSRLHFNTKSTAGSVSTDKLAHRMSEAEMRSLDPASPKEGHDNEG